MTEPPPLTTVGQQEEFVLAGSVDQGRPQWMGRWPRHARQRECTAKVWRVQHQVSSVPGGAVHSGRVKAKAGQWQRLTWEGLMPCERAVANWDLHFIHPDCAPHPCMLPAIMLLTLTHISGNKHRSSLAIG